MARGLLDKQLQDLQDEVLYLGGMVDKAVMGSIDALKSRDLVASERIVKEDDLIDAKRYEIEEKCIDLIAMQQPMAGDLRLIITLLHIAVELERMGDYAEGISKISVMMGDQPPIKPLIDIPRMAEMGTAMLRASLNALVDQDADAATQVCKDDDDVDQIYDDVYHELLFIMIQDPRTTQRATYLLWIAHDLERIADRATNIAERVIYSVTGRLADLNVSKY